MRFRDSIGNELAEGDVVSFALSTGKIIPAIIVQLNSGISNLQGQQQAGIALQATLALPVPQDGVVREVIKAVLIKEEGTPEGAGPGLVT